jgi:GR25 family glycosyltransferase involved in LPS biosynthesis
MLDQLVAYKGRVFFGTHRSTLSGYINRMRGYYVTKHKLEGYNEGTIQSYYFVPADKYNQMRKYHAVKKPIYHEEFPIAWMDIDKGIEELHQ